MSPLVNAAKIKWAAHSASRGDSGFKHFLRHTFVGDAHQRPWSEGSELEAGRGLGSADSDEPTAHSPVAHSPNAVEKDHPDMSNGSVPGSSRDVEDNRGISTGAGEDPIRRRATGKEKELSQRAALGPETEKKKKEKKQRTFFKHLVPKEPFTVRNQIQRTIFNSWLNVLLVAAPVGIAVNYVPAVSRVAVFVINFIAIVPLAGMLSFATEEIALRTGETVGGLLNATFGYVSSDLLFAERQLTAIPDVAMLLN